MHDTEYNTTHDNAMHNMQETSWDITVYNTVHAHATHIMSHNTHNTTVQVTHMSHNTHNTTVQVTMVMLSNYIVYLEVYTTGSFHFNSI